MTSGVFNELNALLNTPVPAELGPARRAGTISEAELAVALEAIFARTKLPVQPRELIRALLLLWHDHLDASHTISQGIENSDGSCVHAVMHRREPDAWNAKYWWRRAGAQPAFPEIARRVTELLNSTGQRPLLKTLVPFGAWDACAYVDMCEAAKDESLIGTLREVQLVEVETLLEHFLRS